MRNPCTSVVWSVLYFFCSKYHFSPDPCWSLLSVFCLHSLCSLYIFGKLWGNSCTSTPSVFTKLQLVPSTCPLFVLYFLVLEISSSWSGPIFYINWSEMRIKVSIKLPNCSVLWLWPFCHSQLKNSPFCLFAIHPLQCLGLQPLPPTTCSAIWWLPPPTHYNG